MHGFSSSPLLLLLSLSVLVYRIQGNEIAYYCDPVNGDDNFSGLSVDEAFKTISRAQLATRAAVPVYSNVTVFLAGGVYDQSAQQLRFTAADSGASASSPVRYTALDQTDPPLLSAGVALEESQFEVVDIQGRKMLQYDLTQHMSLAALGELRSGGLGDCNNIKAELYRKDSRPMHLARYPNVNVTTGAWEWLRTYNICTTTGESGYPKDPCYTSFTAYNSRFQSWLKAPDLWLHGYWNKDWADNHIKISKLQMLGDEEAIFYADNSTPPYKGFLEQARFYGENLLEELDTTDEYYIDRETGMLYVSADYKDTLSEVGFIVSKGMTLMSFADGVKNMEFSGLVFSHAQNVLAISDYPDALLTDVTFKNNEFAGSGNSALVLRGTRLSIDKNNVHNIGCTGISISGGDRMTLEPSQIECTNNVFTNYALWKRTYTPAIKFDGVGTYIASNLIYNAPHQGIFGRGNNHLFEKNYLRDLCLETGDSGAFYVGKSWSNRGNIVRENIFENIRPLEPILLGVPYDYGVYLDDQMAGYEIYNNTFVNNQRGVSLGGGRDNNIHANTFIECDMGVWFDNRGENWDTESCYPGGPFEQDLDSLNYQQDPWASAYPETVNTFKELPCTPQHNKVIDNRNCKVDVYVEPYEGWDQPESDNTIENNVGFEDC